MRIDVSILSTPCKPVKPGGSKGPEHPRQRLISMLKPALLLSVNKLTLIFFFLLAVLPLNARSAHLQVSVSGIQGEKLQNVLAGLSIWRQRAKPRLTDLMIENLHRKAPGEIRKALEPFGYYTAVIKASLDFRDGTWRVMYRVAPGRPVIVAAINLSMTGSGAKNPDLLKYESGFPLRPGDIFDSAVYEKAKDRLHELAANLGYLDANFAVHRVMVYPKRFKANITLKLDTGPLYRFGKVTFEQAADKADGVPRDGLQQDVFRASFLRRFVPFKEGTPFLNSSLFDLQDTLMNSDYFSMVEVNPKRGAAVDHEIPVLVRLKPQKRQRYLLGFGYGTDTGLRGVVGWENRRVNSLGHRFSSELRLSEIKNSLTAKYTIPMAHPATDNLDLNAGWTKENTETSKSEILAVGPSYNHQRRKGLQETVYLYFQKENYDVGDQTGHSRMILPGVTWTWLKADNRLNTRNGQRLILGAKGTHRTMGSNTSFVQGQVHAKLIRSFWESGKFVLRGDLGISWVAKFSALPASQRFFAGGDQSVRGYGYKALGPVNDDGQVIGGRDLLVGSIEYDQTLYKRWGAAVFYDAGNAINELSEPLKQGVGVGLRWVSPVGPVRIDVARPLSKNALVFRLHINIGPDL